MAIRHWSDPLSVTKDEKVALIILNEPIPSRRALDRVWSQASLRICADGGANRLHDLFDQDEEARRIYIPNLIKGDLDSLRTSTRQYYTALGVPCIQDDDQYSTDLTKCIQAVEEHEATTAAAVQYRILLLGGLTGRLDQTIHTLSMLIKLRKKRHSVWAISDQSIACVLDVGHHVIDIDLIKYGSTCGILPVGVDTATITLQGFRWDVADWETSFETQMSTSNELIGPVVQVTTNKPVVWTCELRADSNAST